MHSAKSEIEGAITSGGRERRKQEENIEYIEVDGLSVKIVKANGLLGIKLLRCLMYA